MATRRIHKRDSRRLTNAAFISATSGPSGNATLNGTLDNTGTITLEGSGNFVGGTINNPSGGIIDIQGVDGAEYPFVFATINNSGTIRRSANTGAVGIWTLNNTSGGVIDVETGTLLPWEGPGGVSTGASLIVASGATLQYSTGGVVDTFTGTYAGSGGGQLVVSSGDFVVGASGAIFDFPAGFFEWTGGEIEDSQGPLVNQGTVTVNGSNVRTAGTFDNEGTINIVGTSTLFVGSTLNNDAGGLIDFEGDGSMSDTESFVSNAGTIRKSSGAGTTLLDGIVANIGTIEADSGTLSLPILVDQVSGTTLTAGTWNALNGASIIFPPNTDITTNQANVSLGGAAQPSRVSRTCLPTAAPSRSRTGQISRPQATSITRAA